MKTILLISLFLPGFTAIAQETTREEWEQQQRDRQELLYKDDYQDEIRFRLNELKAGQYVVDSVRDAQSEALYQEQLENKWQMFRSDEEISIRQHQINDPEGWKFSEEEYYDLWKGKFSRPMYYRHPINGSNGGVEVG